MLGWTFPRLRGSAPAAEPAGRLVREHRQVRVQEVDRDALAAAAPRRSRRAPRGRRSSRRGASTTSTIATPDLRRRPRRAGDAHQAADRLHERVVAGQVAPAPLAEAGDLAVDDARIGFRDGVVAEPEPLERARPEVRDDDVRPLAEARRQLAVRVGAAGRARPSACCGSPRGGRSRAPRRRPAATSCACRRRSATRP